MFRIAGHFALSEVLVMANVQLGLADKVALLSLMSLVHEASNADLHAAYGVTIDRESRSRLEKHGYVTCRRDSGRPGRPYVHELTEQGWRRGREELREAPPEKAGKPYRILYAYLNHMDRLMTRLELGLEDLLTVAGVGDAPQRQDVEQRIRTVYADLAKEPGSPVLLRLLRQHLADISREEVDAALLQLVLMPGVYLEPEPKQSMLSDADWHAAITVGGEARHLLTIGRS
ncbi:MAG TPA: hypothetical protein VFA06_18630 [Actinocrinis sp.]|uniref:hypothetical protein n=1 Tax=Actinocrinis sp. TaxID=1920516 RepID=UPI002D368B44|nr:hypothetical protein [Actinocrinis sp.]HZU57896.1 hypothetical protein [Actinocrinis sp.]